jgi:hypothetical protein
VGTGAPSYKGFRFPAEIISHCVWLYYRFPLSLREVEEMMLARGVTVSHEIIWQRTGKFGQAYASGLRRHRSRPGDKWHLDELFIKIRGKNHYLSRAVDNAPASDDELNDQRSASPSTSSPLGARMIKASGKEITNFTRVTIRTNPKRH